MLGEINKKEEEAAGGDGWVNIFVQTLTLFFTDTNFSNADAGVNLFGLEICFTLLFKDK